MPRMKNETHTLLADLKDRLARVVHVALEEGRKEALAQIRDLVGGGGEIPIPHRRGPGRPKGSRNKPKAAKVTKSGKPRKNPWARMTPEQKKERIRKMLAGRGLKPKG